MQRINWKKLRKNIPNKVRVASRSFYEVVWTQDFHSDKSGDLTYGETRFDPQQIVLNTNQKDKEAVHTFVHEVFHALSEEVGANLTESQVRALETAFPAIREMILTLDGLDTKKDKK